MLGAHHLGDASAHFQQALLSALPSRFPASVFERLRVLVDEAGETDATCRLISRSPLDATDLPGPSLVGNVAGASVLRTSLYRRIGGYEPQLFIGGKQTLVSLDMLASGFAIVYAEELLVHHRPSPLRDNGLRATWAALNAMRRKDAFVRDACALFAALPWALTRHRPIPREVEQMREAVRQSELLYQTCRCRP
jgi:hypothetical protein